MRNSKSGTDIDYLVSPVMNSHGCFYNSDNYANIENAPFPNNADANGAYHIAKKALWAVEQFKNSPDDKLKNVKLSITNKEWLEYTQREIE